MNIKKLLLISLLILFIGYNILAQEGYFGKNKITYDDFNWQLFKSPHFDIFYYPEEEHLLNTLVQWLESSYLYIGKKFDWALSERTPVFFYKTRSEFEQTHIIPAFMPPGVGAFAEPLRRRFVIPLDDPPADMKKLIIHEMTHIFEFDYFYNNSFTQQIFSNTPDWLMEGLSEHIAKGYDTLDEMFIRDLAVHDRIPPIPRLGSDYISSYVLGQTILDYIVERYNEDTFRAFILQLRRDGSSMGSIAKAFNEVLKLDINEFNRDWQKWLRDKYVPFLIQKKGADDYGKILNMPNNPATFHPVISPSGDLIAAITIKDDIDISLISAKTGENIKNLTSGFSTNYWYIIGSQITARYHGGKDLDWSPDGNSIVFLAKTDKERSIFIIDAYTGNIKKQIPLAINAALSPSFTSDGKAILLGANEEGVRDIFKIDISTGKTENITKDPYFDYAPVMSPDSKYIYYLSDRKGKKKIFRMNLESGEKEQLTFGEWDDSELTLSKDGKKILYISDEKGIFNIYGLDIEKGIKTQHTDFLGGAFNPQYRENTEDIVYSYYYKNSFLLYEMKLSNPIEESPVTADIKKSLGEEVTALPRDEIGFDSTYLPPKKFEEERKVTDPRSKYSFFIDDAFINGGIASDGTLLTASYFQFSDITSSLKFRLSFATIGSYRNIGLSFYNLSSRFNWGFALFDYKYLFVSNINFSSQDNPLLSRLAVENIGASVFGNYPFTLYTRMEFSLGYLNRDFKLPPSYEESIQSNEDLASFRSRFINGNFLPVTLNLVHDSVLFAPFGPYHGTRYRLSASHAFGISDKFTSFTNLNLDFRNYIELTRDIVLASRLSINHSFGESPNIYFFGGTDTLRGYNYLELVGNTTFFGNVEIRFPLIDRIDFPIGIRLGGIRGVLFFNLGGAFFKDENFEFFEKGSFVLKDAIASFGAGMSFNILGLEFHWDATQTTNLRDTSDWIYSFWIGYSF